MSTRSIKSSNTTINCSRTRAVCHQIATLNNSSTVTCPNRSNSHLGPCPSTKRLIRKNSSIWRRNNIGSTTCKLNRMRLMGPTFIIKSSTRPITSNRSRDLNQWRLSEQSQTTIGLPQASTSTVARWSRPKMAVTDITMGTWCTR